MPGPSPSARANATLGLPEGFKTYSPYPFAGMNTEGSAVAIDDKEFTWRENLVRLGDGNLRTVHDVGTPIYTATPPRTIVWYGFYNINENYYCAVFLDDGSAVQVDRPGGGLTTIAGPGTFYSSTTGFLPFLRQWGNQFIVICNRNTVNDYWAWDGTLLYHAGTAAPNGVNILSGGFNYSSTPNITAYGGQGGGLAFNVVVQAGAVTEVNITNPGTGYEVGDVPVLAFDGGGSDTGAILQAAIDAGGVGGVNITSPGSNYTSATVAFLGGGGVGAAGTVILNTGVVSIPVTAPGSGYTTASISFSGGGGTGAQAQPLINALGQISGVSIISAGSGYTSAPSATLTGNGSGATLGTVVIGGGEITGVSITNPGSGYITAPSVVFSGTGTGATGTALLSAGGVQGVFVIRSGSGYTSVPLIEFVGGGGAGAVGYVLLNGTSIARIDLTAGGSGYTGPFGEAFPPQVTLSGGNGFGASAVAILNGTSVGEIVVTSGGFGYTGSVDVLVGLSPAQIAFNNFLVQSGNPDGFQPFAGSGAGGKVVFTPTSIGSVVVSAQGQFYTSAPSVIVLPGANDAAVATVDLMPYGVSGSMLESFLTRIWIIAPATAAFATIPGPTQFFVSAPGVIWDFATSDGGEEQNNVDGYLQVSYNGIRQSSGYLYLWGDKSANVISNVATSGTPATTTFNYQNVDPQIGLTWRDSLQDFGRAEIFANTIGVYGLYGGAATKISAKMDGIFRDAIFPPTVTAVTPSGAIATIYDVKHYLCLMTVFDPFQSMFRTMILAWNEKDWCLLSQSPALTFIASESMGTTFNAFGTDGTKIYPLFNTPSSNIQKRLNTKSYGSDRSFIVKSFEGIWLTLTDMSAYTQGGNIGTPGYAQGIDGSIEAFLSGCANYNMAIDPDMNTVQPQSYSRMNSVMSVTAPYPYFQVWGNAPESRMAFTSISVQFSSNSPDFVIGNMVVGYTEQKAIF